ncbi:MAG: stage 0 sporulation family protein [bacterium]
MQSDVVEVKFKGQRRGLFVNPAQIPFKVGDYAVVQADKGIDLGRINHISSLLKPPKNGDKSKLKRIIRKSNSSDLERHEKNKAQEARALKVCQEKLECHKLTMKLVDCEYQLDGKKITFHFTAESRVDFRKLVKDVASVYRTRIEFRQIGVRDEARRLGGFGVCGRKLCCSAWIKEFLPVTTQAAKEQNLSLNPSKLAGVCGRLKCCLMYERNFYNQAIKQFPQLAKPIITEKGEGVVSNIDIFADQVIVLYPDDTTETISLAVVKELYSCDESCEHKDVNLKKAMDELNKS